MVKFPRIIKLIEYSNFCNFFSFLINVCRVHIYIFWTALKPNRYVKCIFCHFNLSKQSCCECYLSGKKYEKPKKKKSFNMSQKYERDMWKKKRYRKVFRTKKGNIEVFDLRTPTGNVLRIFKRAWPILM